MKNSTSFCIVILTCLSSCGRTDIGSIKNNTNDTIKLEIKLNYPESTDCPDNYFREELLDKNVRINRNDQNEIYRLISIDTSSNFAVVALMPNQSINLGTVRADVSRKYYKSWEFTELRAAGKNLSVQVKNEGILKLVKREENFFSNDEFEFNIGQSN